MVKTGMVLLLSVCVTCSGCATIVTGGGESQSVRFNSTPRGANVTVDGNFIGETPVSADLTRKDDHYVTMEYGGETKEATISSWPNLWVFGNVIFGGLIGIAVDLFSGSMDGSLTPRDVSERFVAKPYDTDSMDSGATLLQSRHKPSDNDPVPPN